MQASKEQPKVVKIAVVVQTEGEDTQLSEERFVQGKTREEVMAEAMSALFDEKPSKAKKPRAKRRTKAEISAANIGALGDTSRAEEEMKERTAHSAKKEGKDKPWP